jgi:Raf kinase inhibitor-like YbhB/YbcL family protein
MKLTSSAFESGGVIPIKYTCDGQDISPPLKIEDVPSQAKTLVLIMDDPDVPEFIRKDRMWVHWVLFNIPSDTKGIAEGAMPSAAAGKGTGGDMRYRGPCPPDREHRYFFKLYALDCKLDLPEGATKEQVEKAMAGHIISQTELMGRYDRKR